MTTYPARRRRRTNPAPTPSLLERALWADPDAAWKEEHIQAAIVMKLRQHGVAFEVGLEGARLSKSQRGKAKIQGMDAGKCDIKVYQPGARTTHIELKRKGGRVSSEQSRWHDKLRALGFDVHVVVASCPQDGIDQVSDIIGVDLSIK
jgi:hypothetical protein